MGPAAARLTLKVFDLQGRLVRILVDKVPGAGTHSVFWDGTDEAGKKVASGVYLYRLQAGEQAQTRKLLVGSGDRSERIRTYNFPQGRITDHRINLTLYKLDEVLQGDLDDVIEPLIAEHQADLLAAMGEE